DKKQLRQLPTAFENYRNSLPLPLRKEGGTSPSLTLKGEECHRFASVSFAKNSQLKIGIAPFAAHQGKIYPLEKMEEVIVNVNVPVKIFLFGGGDEEFAIMRRWAEKYDNVRLAADECHGLKEELELMKKLDVMVSMDSANMHLASLVGTRVVSIWGATHPYAGFLGWGQRMDDCVQRDDLKCRPCSIYGNKPCMRGDMACMQIDPKEVVERIFAHPPSS
ncbi:MAG: glycosyltransferase family 9 protein, partial [Prevotella sp.]|nr:glycosyltransferase family 9 protein [Prevotella sp.]